LAGSVKGRKAIIRGCRGSQGKQIVGRKEQEVTAEKYGTDRDSPVGLIQEQALPYKPWEQVELWQLWSLWPLHASGTYGTFL